MCKNIEPVLLVLISSAVLVITILATTISTAVIIISVRTKAKLQRELEVERRRMPIYEDIDLYPPHATNISTTENLAYDGKYIIKRLQTQQIAIHL